MNDGITGLRLNGSCFFYWGDYGSKVQEATISENRLICELREEKKSESPSDH
jgi:hypothetical protein